MGVLDGLTLKDAAGAGANGVDIANNPLGTSWYNMAAFGEVLQYWGTAGSYIATSGSSDRAAAYWDSGEGAFEYRESVSVLVAANHGQPQNAFKAMLFFRLTPDGLDYPNGYCAVSYKDAFGNDLVEVYTTSYQNDPSTWSLVFQEVRELQEGDRFTARIDQYQNIQVLINDELVIDTYDYTYQDPGYWGIGIQDVQIGLDNVYAGPYIPGATGTTRITTAWQSGYKVKKRQTTAWQSSYKVKVRPAAKTWQSGYRVLVRPAAKTWQSSYLVRKRVTASWASSYNVNVATRSVVAWNSSYKVRVRNSASWASGYRVLTRSSAAWPSSYVVRKRFTGAWASSYTVRQRNTTAWAASYLVRQRTSAAWPSGYVVDARLTSAWLSGYNVLALQPPPAITLPTKANLTEVKAGASLTDMLATVAIIESKTSAALAAHTATLEIDP